MRVWLWLVYKFTKNYCRLQLFSELIQTHWQIYLSWQNSYPNLKTTCHIKLNFFLWTKLLESLLLAKYLVSVAARTARNSLNIGYFSKKFLFLFLLLSFFFLCCNIVTHSCRIFRKGSQLIKNDLLYIRFKWPN